MLSGNLDHTKVYEVIAVFLMLLYGLTIQESYDLIILF